MRKLLGTTRFWIFIMLLVLLLCAALAYRFAQPQPQACVAKIYQDGQLLRTVDLSQVDTEERFVVKAKNGGSNTIAIAPGRISVQEASCPDHVCIQQGWITGGAYPIVCLPNKLIIRIEEDGHADTAPDMMTQ